MGESQTTAHSSLEAPTMVSAGGGSSPVMAIVEYLSAHECRMRSVNPFGIGAIIDFSVAIHGAPTVPLRGTVVASKQNGARFSYVVSLQSSNAQADAIAKVTEVAQARKSAHAPDVATADGLTRASVRVPVDFEVRYARLGASPREARAINISTGGVHMNTPDDIPVGTSIDLEIPLGDQPVRVRGRIVAHQEMSPNYNVAFFDLNAEARDIIARFIEKSLD